MSSWCAGSSSRSCKLWSGAKECLDEWILLAGAARAPEGLRPVPDRLVLAAIAGASTDAPAMFDRDDAIEFAVSRRLVAGRSVNELGGLVCRVFIDCVRWDVYDWLYSDGES